MKTTPQRRRQQSEMQLARGRLRGALNDAVQLSDDDDNTDGTDYYNSADDLPKRGRPPKNLQAVQQSPRNSRQSSMSPGKLLTPSKRRKREQHQQQQQQQTAMQSQKIQAESFVMKLFDRSLDLSKYTEQTSLYPICRAWMANQPRNPSIRSYREHNSPSPVLRDTNGEEVLMQLRRREIREIQEMPAPVTTDLPKIPPPLDYENTDISESSENEDLGKEELLAKHMSKWKEVKCNWIKHTKRYQQRNQTNHLIIKELFKNN